MQNLPCKKNLPTQKPNVRYISKADALAAVADVLKGADFLCHLVDCDIFEAANGLFCSPHYKRYNLLRYKISTGCAVGYCARMHPMAIVLCLTTYLSLILARPRPSINTLNHTRYSPLRGLLKWWKSLLVWRQDWLMRQASLLCLGICPFHSGKRRTSRRCLLRHCRTLARPFQSRKKWRRKKCYHVRPGFRLIWGTNCPQLRIGLTVIQIHVGTVAINEYIPLIGR